MKLYELVEDMFIARYCDRQSPVHIAIDYFNQTTTTSIQSTPCFYRGVKDEIKNHRKGSKKPESIQKLLDLIFHIINGIIPNCNLVISELATSTIWSSEQTLCN